MKKLLISIMLITLFAATVHAAQNQSDDRQGNASKKQRSAQMRKELNLTDAQVAEMKKIRQNGGTKEDMRAVLTDEQRAKVDSMREQAKARRAASEASAAEASADGSQAAESDNG
jgi:Spy/CpxP family protein refolding chaperone